MSSKKSKLRKNFHKKGDSYRILMTGGGTGGPVTPLLAIVDSIRFNSKEKWINKSKFDFLWIGTKKGPEKKMVTELGIDFRMISSGKLRRYFSWKNFIDPFRIIWGFFQSLRILSEWKPNLMMSAGGFVSVPVAYACWFLGIPILIHQQDIRPGLANKLMTPLANKVTVTFKKSLKDYPDKSVWTGNPVRRFTKEVKGVKKSDFRIKGEFPIILVLGGGTGATGLNNLIKRNFENLLEICQVIHLTGKGKDLKELKKRRSGKYRQYDFLKPDEMAKALFLADGVVSRCGMGTLTEIAYLKKPSILIPMPGTHQDDNAEIFAKHKAAIVLDEREVADVEFLKSIKNILGNEKLKKGLAKNLKKVMISGAEERIIKEVRRILI